MGANALMKVDHKEFAVDIKIGFVDNGRELAIANLGSVSGVSVTDQQEAVSLFNKALVGQTVVELSDDKGRRFLVQGSRIAFVEIGSTAPRTVGFAG